MILDAPEYLRVDNIDMMGGVSVQVNGTVVRAASGRSPACCARASSKAFQQAGIKDPLGLAAHPLSPDPPARGKPMEGLIAVALM